MPGCVCTCVVVRDVAALGTFPQDLRQVGRGMMHRTPRRWGGNGGALHIRRVMRNVSLARLHSKASPKQTNPTIVITTGRLLFHSASCTHRHVPRPPELPCRSTLPPKNPVPTPLATRCDAGGAACAATAAAPAVAADPGDDKMLPVNVGLTTVPASVLGCVHSAQCTASPKREHPACA